MHYIVQEESVLLGKLWCVVCCCLPYWRMKRALTGELWTPLWGLASLELVRSLYFRALCVYVYLFSIRSPAKSMNRSLPGTKQAYANCKLKMVAIVKRKREQIWRWGKRELDAQASDGCLVNKEYDNSSTCSSYGGEIHHYYHDDTN